MPPPVGGWPALSPLPAPPGAHLVELVDVDRGELDKARLRSPWWKRCPRIRGTALHRNGAPVAAPIGFAGILQLRRGGTDRAPMVGGRPAVQLACARFRTVEAGRRLAGARSRWRWRGLMG